MASNEVIILIIIYVKINKKCKKLGYKAYKKTLSFLVLLLYNKKIIKDNLWRFFS